MYDDLNRKMLHGNLETLVLRLLAKQPMHGYALRWNLAELSRGHFQPALGRLYPLLAQLQRRTWVMSTWQKAGKIRRRRVYRLTARGRDALADRVWRWRRFAQAMDRVLK